MSALRKILNLACFATGLVWTFLIAAVALPVFLLSQRLGHGLQRAWAKGWLKLMGIRVDLSGLENLDSHRALVLAPNHESNFDIFVLASLPTDFKWVSKIELARLPFVGWTMRAMGCFFVRRDKSGHDRNVMQEVEDGLRAGNSVAIFPEGTRTRTGDLLPFKKGAFKSAQNSGVPLCPIGIRGTRGIAPPGQIPSKRGHRVAVRIGRPFPAPMGEDLTTLMERFRAELVKLLEECDAASRNPVV